MSVPVTVDSDDLEALLQATGAIKAIETALKQAKDDPFLERVKPRITAAHDRIANAWRGALRQEQYPERFSPATAEEKSILYTLWRRGAGDLDGTDAREPNEHRGLMVRGFIEYGISRLNVMWSSSGESTMLESHVWAIRLTRRGREAIDDMIREEKVRVVPPKSFVRGLIDLFRKPAG